MLTMATIYMPGLGGLYPGKDTYKSSTFPPQRRVSESKTQPVNTSDLLILTSHQRGGFGLLGVARDRCCLLRCIVGPEVISDAPDEVNINDLETRIVAFLMGYG